MPSEQLILGLLLIGQTIVSAVALSFIAVQFREQSQEVRSVAQMTERILNRVEGNE